MKSYQHLLNAMVGLCAALIGVRLILPAILEIPGFISLLTDETIPQPWEIFKFYLSSACPSWNSVCWPAASYACSGSQSEGAAPLFSGRRSWRPLDTCFCPSQF